MKTRVSIVKCKTYNDKEVGLSVARAFELLGGISSFVRKGERVLIKPNMLSGKTAEFGVNTHIEIIRAVVRLIKECGGSPLIGDTPGGALTSKEVYASSGILSLSQEEEVECLEVNNVKMVSGIPMASYFFECDKIISLPKMKTHSLMGLTGAVKNMYGAVSGLYKSELHKAFPRPEKFANVLVDVFKEVKPHLVLMDAVIAMDGNGPSAGRLKNVGLLIGGEDSVAVDTVFSHLIGMDPLSLLTTKEAYRRGLGQTDLKKIDLVGEKIEKGLIKDFDLPRSKAFMRLPSPILKKIAGFVKFRPYIDEGLCKRCMLCVKTCPVSVITVDKKITNIDYKKCIRCMCCHEVCPHRAIEVKRGILARVFGL
ncbi:DUF362 domain-containing protein [Candidatus Omnitrophota bacterium]